jgi:hypothetical protein
MDIKKKPTLPSRGIAGSPKKGGAGGKGTWGKGGVDDLINVAVDPNDPNYCSDEDEEVVVLKKVDVVSPIEAILQEYFASGEVAETIKSLREVHLEHSQFIKKAMILAMEKGGFERELISQLLSKAYNNPISAAKIADGFQLLLNSLEDVVLDTPDAADLASKFLARAIMDEVVPPVFLKHCSAESRLAKEAVSLANALVTEKHRSERLEHIWGPGDLASVKRLKQEASLLFEEYLSNGDLNEADASVRKMSAPSFHPQLVKQAIRLALQKNESERKRIMELLAFFVKTGLVSSDHMQKGFRVCFDSLEDLKLDSPSAPQLLSSIAAAAKQEGWLSTDFRESQVTA